MFVKGKGERGKGVEYEACISLTAMITCRCDTAAIGSIISPRGQGMAKKG